MCGDDLILGSSNLQYRSLSASRIYQDLPPHNGLILHFFFYQIDDYDGQNNDMSSYTVTFKINGKKFPYTVQKSGSKLCGNSSIDSKNKVVLEDSQHTASSLDF